MFKNPLFVKFVALGAVVVALLVGLSSIEGVVRDRQLHLSQAQRGVADSLAGPQTLLGPLIHQSCTERWESVVGSGEHWLTELSTHELREMVKLRREMVE